MNYQSEAWSVLGYTAYMLDEVEKIPADVFTRIPRSKWNYESQYWCERSLFHRLVTITQAYGAGNFKWICDTFHRITMEEYCTEETRILDYAAFRRRRKLQLLIC